MPPAPPASLSMLSTADGWYVRWGPTAGQPANIRIQRVIGLALAADGSTVVPLVVRQTDNVVVAAAAVSHDYVLDHPQHFTRADPQTF